MKIGERIQICDHYFKAFKVLRVNAILNCRGTVFAFGLPLEEIISRVCSFLISLIELAVMLAYHQVFNEVFCQVFILIKLLSDKALTNLLPGLSATVFSTNLAYMITRVDLYFLFNATFRQF